MKEEFLGKGWKIDLTVDENKQIAMVGYEDDIKESILIILNTSKGERVMRPDFGCGIHDFMFSVVNTATLSLIKHHVREALATWEPRIEVLAVTTSTERLNEGIISIDVRYRVRRTNTVFNLVYPFYTQEG